MLYGLAAFLGAFLLLFIQPYLGKLLSPTFGGTSQVWMTCMLFFQACLLLGYAYAHLLVTKGTLKFQRNFHGLMLMISAGLLFYQGKMGSAPLSVPPTDPGAGRELVESILGYLIRQAALPAILLSSTSPILQSWYCKKKPEGSPYRLYASSNLGSLLGLLAYPFVAEKEFSQPVQGWLFALGYSGMLLLPFLVPRLSAWPHRSKYGSRTSIREIVAWAFCSAVGSCLFMSGSTQVSTEVAAIPLLWVIPLALYLLTFILIFEYSEPAYQRGLLVLASVCLAVSYWSIIWPASHSKALHQVWASFGTVFFGALLCHGFLYALRPPVERLTAFYLSLATGGVLGAIFVALIAPSLYDRLMELPAAVMLAGIVGVLWGFSFPSRAWRFIVLLPAAAAAVGVAGLWTLSHKPGIWLRDLYGSMHVMQAGSIRTLVHGKVVHGAVPMNDLAQPLAYYYADSGAGLAFSQQRRRKKKLNVGMMGLGVGSLSTYITKGDHLVVYEISPAVLYIAGPKGKAFPLLKQCAGDVEVVQGDARVSLAREFKNQGGRNFDLLFLDAFNSDTLPWHLLTVEALKLYLDHLAPEGLLVANVSTRLPLDRVICSGAKSLGAYGLLIGVNPPVAEAAELQPYLFKTSYLVISRSKKALMNETLLEKAEMSFGPTRFAEKVLDFPFLPEPWTDARSSLSDLVFEERAFR